MTKKLTANFYDADSGEYIEIHKGKVVARQQSILSKQERLTINQERAQRLVTQQATNVTETPYVQPEMFPVANEDQVSHAEGGVMIPPEMTWGPEKPKAIYSGQATPLKNQQEEPMIPPVMTWD